MPQGIDGKRGSVVDELVVATHLVHIEQRKLVAGAGFAENNMTLLALANVAGAGIDGYHQIGGGIGQTLERVGGVIQSLVIPAVFANHKAHLGRADAQHPCDVRAGLEVTTLIKDAISWQQLLGILQDHFPILDDQQGVVKGFANTGVSRWGTSHPQKVGCLAAGELEFVQAEFDASLKPCIVEQVARVIGGEAHLGEHHQMGALVVRGAGGIEHQGNIALHVTDGRIDLGNGNAKHGSVLVIFLS